MKKYSLISHCTVLSAFIAASGLVAAADAPGLSPTPAAGLKPVPQRTLFGRATSGLRQVQYQPDGNQKSTVAAELQRLQQAGAQSAALRQTPAPQEKSGGFQLPKLSLGGSEVREERQSSRRERKSSRSPGLLKRLFGSLSGDKAEETTSDETTKKPATAVPRPPVLKYVTNDSASGRKGIPARTASFQRAQAPSSTDSRSLGVQKAVPTAASSAFVSPFETDDADRDILLDLDSLVERETPAPATNAAGDSVVEPSAEIPAAGDAAAPADLVEVQVADTIDPQPEQTATEDETVGAPALETVESDIVEVEVVEEGIVKDDTAAIVEVDLSAEPESAPTFDDDTVVVDVETTAVDVTETKAAADEKAPVVTYTRSKREQQLFQITSRTGLRRFKGFCPVQLRDNRELIDSDGQFEAKFGLHNYQFSSAEAKAVFEANPARYAPAFGGSDVVVLANSDEEVAGLLDFSLWYRDRLFMFSSRETQQMFSRDPARFTQQF